MHGVAYLHAVFTSFIQSDKLLKLEAEKNFWMDKCLTLQGPSSDDVQTSTEPMVRIHGCNNYCVSSELFMVTADRTV